VVQALLLRALSPVWSPAGRQEPVGGPDRVLLLVVENDLEDLVVGVHGVAAYQSWPSLLHLAGFKVGRWAFANGLESVRVIMLSLSYSCWRVMRSAVLGAVYRARKRLVGS